MLMQTSARPVPAAQPLSVSRTVAREMGSLRVASERCTFCGRAKREVGTLIEGPLAMICDVCVNGCLDALRSRPATCRVLAFRPVGSDKPETLEENPSRIAGTCHFCGRPESETACLLHGYVASICDECVMLCEDFLADERDERKARPQ